MSSSDTEPHLLVEKCGSNRGNPIYVITKHIPSVVSFSLSESKLRADAFISALAMAIQVGRWGQLTFFVPTTTLLNVVDVASRGKSDAWI